MRIVYVIDSLASKGGAERILCDKMNYLFTNYGYDVYVITCYQNVSQHPNAYNLSEQVHQINLNIPYYSQYQYCYPWRLLVKWSIYRQLIRDLTSTVQRINPDILVGLGYFQADIVSGLRCRAVKVIESHEARIFTMSNHGLNRSWLSRVYMWFYKRLYFQSVERQADVVVTLTKGDALEWSKARRIEVIPNFTVMPVIKQSTCESKRVIAVGRLEWQKGFDRMIAVWAKVIQQHPDWRLDIFGSGTLEGDLNNLVKRYNLENSVEIHPFTPNINKEYSDSSIFALSSRFEGFGLVLLEAMQNGLPCVTFDCPFGPSDIVSDAKTGYVVRDGDVSCFASRLSVLMDDDLKRQKFGRAAAEEVKKYDVNAVMLQWKRLFEQLVSTV